MNITQEQLNQEKKDAQTLGIKTILLNKDTELYNEIIKYINDTK